MMNHVAVMGRLTRDPELRHTQSGTPVANFSFACGRNYKDKETGKRETDFFDVVAWRQTGEFAAKYLRKGRIVVVEGRLQVRKWTDKEGGKRQTVEILAENLYFADSKRNDGESSPGAFGNAGDEYAPPTDGGIESGSEMPSQFCIEDEAPDKVMDALPF